MAKRVLYHKNYCTISLGDINMKTNTITLIEEFDKLWYKLQTGENFTLLRYGDGERAIMTGKVVKAQEGWESTAYISSLGKALNATLQLNDTRVIYAISCPCCDTEAYYWYSSRIKNKNRTFANIFVNANYQKFIECLESLHRDVIYIGNYRGCGKKIGGLNILRYYAVGDDCIDFWQNSASELLQKIKNEFGSHCNLLYIVSAGPMSEPIITELFANNPNNCYIDVGSAIDIYTHNKVTRPYMLSGSEYAAKNCWMHDHRQTSFDVTAVLTLYKRPENLPLQIKAIEEQTLRPNKIWLFQDGIDSIYKIELNEIIKNKFDKIESKKNNFGVWERFRFASTTDSEYVVMFDDDTIPGERWLENCHTNMLEQEGLYGTIGIIMENPREYARSGYFRVGWVNPFNERLEVDFVGHSWFYRTQWSSEMFKDTADLQALKTAGEDMAFSHRLKCIGIKTFVPAHYKSNAKFWGSLPEYAFNLGLGGQALSSTSINNDKMSKGINILLDKGFQPLNYSNKKYVSNIKRKIYKKKVLFWLIRIAARLLPLKRSVRSKIRNRFIQRCCGAGYNGKN